jgi:hypothetical protein
VLGGQQGAGAVDDRRVHDLALAVLGPLDQSGGDAEREHHAAAAEVAENVLSGGSRQADPGATVTRLSPVLGRRVPRGRLGRFASRKRSLQPA